MLASTCSRLTYCEQGVMNYGPYTFLISFKNLLFMGKLCHVVYCLPQRYVSECRITYGGDKTFVFTPSGVYTLITVPFASTTMNGEKEARHV